MSRLRPYSVVGFFIAAAASGALVFGLGNPAFHVKKLSVTGLSRVSRGDVVARASIGHDENVWLLNTRAIESRIEALPYVETAEVKRLPIADVTISIRERAPSACVRDVAGRSVTIDAENRILENGCSDAGLVAYALRVPLEDRVGAYVHVRELAELEADGGTLGTGGPHFRAFSHDRYGELVAMLPGGISVQFGDEGDLEGKDRMIEPILAQIGPRASEVESVDLRARATPVVEFRAPAIRRHPQLVDTQ